MQTYNDLIELARICREQASSALAGDRSEPVRLGVREHTHALFALKVQRKVSNAIAGFTRPRIIFGSGEIAATLADQPVCQQVCQNPRPSCIFPVPQLKRAWSLLVNFGPRQRELSRHLKYLARTLHPDS